MTTHFIFDYETFGQDVNKCAIIDCSYVAFEWDRFTSDEPYTIDELLSNIKTSKLDVKKQVTDHGFIVEKSSVEWWGTQGGVAREKIKPLPTDLSLEQYIEDILSYSERYRIKYWWSRANTFDPIILARCVEKLGQKKRMDACLPFWGIRDTRTFIDAKLSFKNPKNGFVPIKNEALWNTSFQHHSSAHDIMADVLRLQTLIRLENNLDILE